MKFVQCTHKFVNGTHGIFWVRYSIGVIGIGDQDVMVSKIWVNWLIRELHFGYPMFFFSDKCQLPNSKQPKINYFAGMSVSHLSSLILWSILRPPIQYLTICTTKIKTKWYKYTHFLVILFERYACVRD